MEWNGPSTMAIRYMLDRVPTTASGYTLTTGDPEVWRDLIAQRIANYNRAKAEWENQPIYGTPGKDGC